MPVYCYKCFDCEHYAEIKQSFSDKPLAECPECGGDFRRVIRDIGVIFKGSGFHTTDYSGSKKSALSTPGETAKTPTSTSTSSTEVQTEVPE
jgi:putative FmdB family regulatory protein